MWSGHRRSCTLTGVKTTCGTITPPSCMWSGHVMSSQKGSRWICRGGGCPAQGSPSMMVTNVSRADACFFFTGQSHHDPVTMLGPQVACRATTGWHSCLRIEFFKRYFWRNKLTLNHFVLELRQQLEVAARSRQQRVHDFLLSPVGHGTAASCFRHWSFWPTRNIS